MKSIKTVTVRSESLDDHQKGITPSSAGTTWAYKRWESVQDEEREILGYLEY